MPKKRSAPYRSDDDCVSEASSFTTSAANHILTDNGTEKLHGQGGIRSDDRADPDPPREGGLDRNRIVVNLLNAYHFMPFFIPFRVKNQQKSGFDILTKVSKICHNFWARDFYLHTPQLKCRQLISLSEHSKHKIKRLGDNPALFWWKKKCEKNGQNGFPIDYEWRIADVIQVVMTKVSKICRNFWARYFYLHTPQLKCRQLISLSEHTKHKRKRLGDNPALFCWIKVIKIGHF